MKLNAKKIKQKINLEIVYKNNQNLTLHQHLLTLDVYVQEIKNVLNKNQINVSV